MIAIHRKYWHIDDVSAEFDLTTFVRLDEGNGT